MKGVQCYELFGGIALKIHTFSFFIFHSGICIMSGFSKELLISHNICIQFLSFTDECFSAK